MDIEVNAYCTWREKITHAVALGIGVAIACGGGLQNFGLVVPMILVMIFTPSQRPRYALGLSAFIVFGLYASEMLFFNALTMAVLAVVLGLLGWLGSQKMFGFLCANRSIKENYLWFLPFVYVLIYMIVTAIMSIV